MRNLFLLTLALVAPASWANTNCTDASGEVQYRHQGYNGGIPPRNGDVIGTIQIRVRGILVSESIAYQGLNPELGSITPTFTEEAVLHQESGNSGFSKDFSAKLTLTKSAGKFEEVKEIQLPFSAYVICRYNFLAVP